MDQKTSSRVLAGNQSRPATGSTRHRGLLGTPGPQPAEQSPPEQQGRPGGAEDSENETHRGGQQVPAASSTSRGNRASGTDAHGNSTRP